MTDRIIALIDMDCFFVQVEQKFNPSLVGKPCAVVQYNGWRGGGIIAVSYEARDRGVGRYLRGDDAKKICPEIELVRVPELNGKADLTKYRDAGHEVIEVLGSFAKCVERASVDEAYVDLTDEVKAEMTQQGLHNFIRADHLPYTYVVGYGPSEAGNSDSDRSIGLDKWLKELNGDGDSSCPFIIDDIRLAVAASIVEKMRQAILDKTGFQCSAGIAHNKMLSKLACGLHKPNRQTILPQHSVPDLFQELPLNKVRNLGGKLGKKLAEIGVETMGHLGKCSIEELQKLFGDKTGPWLHDLGQGIDKEPVKQRQLPQSIGCSKNFPGKNALTTPSQVRLWLNRLATELEGRLLKDQETNFRTAKTLSVYALLEGNNAGVSRACGITCYSVERISESAYNVLEKLNTCRGTDSWNPAILSLGMAAGKFQEFSGTSTSLFKSYFIKPPQQSESACTSSTIDDHDEITLGNKEILKDNSNESATTDTSGALSPQKRIGFFASRLAQKTDNTASMQGTSDVSHNGNQINSKPCENKKLAPFSTWTKSKAAVSTKSVKSLKEPLTLESIDLDVMRNLPADIQEEIRSHLDVAASNCKTETHTKSVTGIERYFKTQLLQPPENEIQEAKAFKDSETVAPDNNEESSKAIAPEDVVICERCNQKITVWTLSEHNDYHIALDLQNEVSRASVQPKNNPVTNNKIQGKRKGKQSKAALVKPKKVKSISSFFNTSSAGT